METPPNSPPETPPSSSPETSSNTTVSSHPKPQKTPKTMRFSVFVIVFLLAVGLVAGGLIGYAVTYSDFNGKLNRVQAQLNSYSQNATYYPNATFELGSNVSLSNLYSEVQSSVVVIQDVVTEYNIFGQAVYDLQQGSGFIASVDNQLVIVTNDHVVADSTNVTVSFSKLVR